MLGTAALHHHGDGHGQGDGEEDAHAFENVGVAAAMARVMLTPRVMAAAIISMMSIGSAAVLAMRESIDSGFGLVKALGPYWFRLCAACSLVRLDVHRCPAC